MSAEELEEWRAFYQIEPWGETRADLRAGSIAAPLLNAWTKKGSRRAKPSDWIMRFEPKEPQDPDQMRTLLAGFAEACKAQDQKG